MRFIHWTCGLRVTSSLCLPVHVSHYFMFTLPRSFLTSHCVGGSGLLATSPLRGGDSIWVGTLTSPHTPHPTQRTHTHMHTTTLRPLDAFQTDTSHFVLQIAPCTRSEVSKEVREERNYTLWMSISIALGSVKANHSIVTGLQNGLPHGLPHGKICSGLVTFFNTLITNLFF